MCQVFQSVCRRPFSKQWFPVRVDPWQSRVPFFHFPTVCRRRKCGCDVVLPIPIGTIRAFKLTHLKQDCSGLYSALAGPGKDIQLSPSCPVTASSVDIVPLNRLRGPSKIVQQKQSEIWLGYAQKVPWMLAWLSNILCSLAPIVPANPSWCVPLSVIFHFETRRCDENQTLVDDSRKMGKPMELVLGKKFKLEVWETIVQAMAVGEVAKFTVDKSLVSAYPFVSKTLRDAGKPNAQRSHCCGTTLQNQGIGHEDLNQMIKEPQDLQFTIELLKVERPGEYTQESWQLTEDEKLAAVPRLKEEGNHLYSQRQYQAAADKYAQAIGYLEQLILSSCAVHQGIGKPRDAEWNEAGMLRNCHYSSTMLSKLLLQDFYPVIEHCTTVLQFKPGE
ncbi:Aryl-hydrocarbon-interacting protein-like 1 [Homalodisca vitripennis]|nr:Aryl-hydrocarbon-interacting protein-like 1 [Homalodisca vitripennis]